MYRFNHTNFVFVSFVSCTIYIVLPRIFEQKTHFIHIWKCFLTLNCRLPNLPTSLSMCWNSNESHDGQVKHTNTHIKSRENKSTKKNKNTYWILFMFGYFASIYFVFPVFATNEFFIQKWRVLMASDLRNQNYLLIHWASHFWRVPTNSMRNNIINGTICLCFTVSFRHGFIKCQQFINVTQTTHSRTFSYSICLVNNGHFWFVNHSFYMLYIRHFPYIWKKCY